MKRLLSLTILSAVVFLSMAATPLSNASKRSLVGVNAYNATTGSASIQLYGPSSLTISLGALSSGSYGPINTGTYVVYMYCSAPGSHTYMFGSQYTTNSNGYAAFYDVNITTTTTAGIN